MLSQHLTVLVQLKQNHASHEIVNIDACVYYIFSKFFVGLLWFNDTFSDISACPVSKFRPIAGTNTMSS